jgi:hypothetical protein
MDAVFFSALQGRKVKRVTCAYDIWCKYHKKINERAAAFPSEMTEDFKNMDVRGYVGMFHLPAHGAECRTRYNLNYAKGAGHTDGEGQERVWAIQGLVAVQTSEMGPANRHLVLDDTAGDNNFRRFLNLSESLV